MTSLNLATLPSDVIRTVIGQVGLLNIDDAKLISPRWNTMIIEHLAVPNRSSELKWFRWDSDEFGGMVTFLANQRESFSYSHSETLASRKVNRVLSRCSKISSIELHVKNLDKIKSALCNLPIGDLTIVGEDGLQPDSRALVLDFLRACGERGQPVQRFITSILFFPMNLHLDFLIQCAKLAAEVVVVCKDNDSYPQNLHLHLPLQLSWHMRCLRDTLTNTQQVHAQLTTENNGWNEIYRIVIKAV